MNLASRAEYRCKEETKIQVNNNIESNRAEAAICTSRASHSSRAELFASAEHSEAKGSANFWATHRNRNREHCAV